MATRGPALSDTGRSGSRVKLSPGIASAGLSPGDELAGSPYPSLPAPARPSAVVAVAVAVAVAAATTRGGRAYTEAVDSTDKLPRAARVAAGGDHLAPGRERSLGSECGRSGIRRGQSTAAPEAITALMATMGFHSSLGVWRRAN